MRQLPAAPQATPAAIDMAITAMYVFSRPSLPPSGRLIRVIRRDVLGLTQKEFGALLNFHGNTVSRWEAGSLLIDQATCKAIVRLIERCAAATPDHTIRLSVARQTHVQLTLPAYTEPVSGPGRLVDG